MTLEAGTRLGPYEILSPLGAEGMGEVYRARDARLGCEVAIKVLPSSGRRASIPFGRRCRELGVRPSMGSVGDCYDNAVIRMMDDLPRPPLPDRHVQGIEDELGSQVRRHGPAHDSPAQRSSTTAKYRNPAHVGM